MRCRRPELFGLRSVVTVTASMGLLLLTSLGCTLLVSLVFLPALLAALRGPATPPR